MTSPFAFLHCILGTKCLEEAWSCYNGTLTGYKLDLIQSYCDKECNNHSLKQIGWLKDFYFNLDLTLSNYQDFYSVKKFYLEANQKQIKKIITIYQQ